ncbi:hypothetical protein BC827DRAFT_1269959 [Russula dissimulans]|nr:hypothetical protein BC827DRAFT_1269959 [Russula dissimulans]
MNSCLKPLTPPSRVPPPGSRLPQLPPVSHAVRVQLTPSAFTVGRQDQTYYFFLTLTIHFAHAYPPFARRAHPFVSPITPQLTPDRSLISSSFHLYRTRTRTFFGASPGSLCSLIAPDDNRSTFFRPPDFARSGSRVRQPMPARWGGNGIR